MSKGSGIKGKVGAVDIEWLSLPKGDIGESIARVGGQEIAVRWRRDVDGLWIETPTGVFGFDFDGYEDEAGSLVYRVSEREGNAAWDALNFVRAGEEAAGGEATGKKKSLRVRAQMPGKIVRVLVKTGDTVEKGQGLLVMEAMKMENEIRAQAPGTIAEVKVTEGQAVESGADLLILA